LLVLKNISPSLQVAGTEEPDLAGMVEAAPEKSTFLVCVFTSTKVWPLQMEETSHRRVAN